MSSTHTITMYLAGEADPADYAAKLEIPVFIERDWTGEIVVSRDCFSVDGRKVRPHEENSLTRYMVGECVKQWRNSEAGQRAIMDWRIAEPAERAARIADAKHDMRAAAD